VKYILIDRYDNVRGTTNTDLKENAEHYFVSRKKIDKESFDTVWRVMSEDEYRQEYRMSLHNRQVEWWKDDESYLDIDR